jgi:hypothetical protein
MGDEATRMRSELFDLFIQSIKLGHFCVKRGVGDYLSPIAEAHRVNISNVSHAIYTRPTMTYVFGQPQLFCHHRLEFGKSRKCEPAHA